MSSAPIQFEVAGVKELGTTLGLAMDALRDPEEAVQGWMRPQRIPGVPGKRYVVDPEFTLEGSLRAAFASSGQSVYHTGWTGYASEPRYARLKAAAGGGVAVLVWEGSADPLMDTLLDVRHPEHIESVDGFGFIFGTARAYALRLHKGGFYQPWDQVYPSARPILVVTQEMAREFARGVQRLIISRTGGGSAAPRVNPFGGA